MHLRLKESPRGIDTSVILFFDRSVGTVVPRILKWHELRLPVDIEYHEEHFDIALEDDDDWLHIVGNWGCSINGHDRYHEKSETELSAILQYQIGCLYLWGAGASRRQKLRCFARAFEGIVDADAKTPKPFVFDVARSGKLARLL